jgi:hypothetical protein
MMHSLFPRKDTMNTHPNLSRSIAVASLVGALTFSLAACAEPVEPEGVISEVQSQEFTDVQTAVAEAVASESVSVTLVPENQLTIAVAVKDADAVNADAVDAALEAAWSASTKSADAVVVAFTVEFIPVEIAEYVEELGITPMVENPTAVVVDAAQLAERYDG